MSDLIKDMETLDQICGSMFCKITLHDDSVIYRVVNRYSGKTRAEGYEECKKYMEELREEILNRDPVIV